MRTESIDSPEFLAGTAKPTGLDKLARRAVHSRLRNLRRGQIVISEDGEHTSYGAITEDFPLTAQICVRHPKFYSDVAFGGTIGAGEAYIQGYWGCDELATLIRILLRNRDVLENVDSGAARLTRPLQKALHWLNKNTRSGSRRNISAHYDLGNDFYGLWLDKRMMYSSAYYDSPDTPLEIAAAAKLDRVCRKLELTPGDSVIEIGSGWGGFAIYAAENYGCHVTTTTISRRQYELASQRIASAGLEDRITLLAHDYRDLQGSFDKLVSIEMIEAVGHQYHNTFFRKCCELLKPEGMMLLQAITIADQQYEQYKKSVDFIRRYIFPGGCLTSVTDMCRTLTEHTDMRVIDLEDIGPHYATTLRHWRDRFFAEIEKVRELGYSDQFIRMWEYYLCFCESAFTERAIGDVQLLLMRPDARSSLLRS
ncbi:MAG: cyclopropane-fatty-acyl-phospholipid synthase family protein [Gammaproteobacteria bacterium]|nr:cyclopropane-fatty-acyl-phospholipid synthase family protein [Gammaproteobacteria bacterium]